MKKMIIFSISLLLLACDTPETKIQEVESVVAKIEAKKQHKMVAEKIEYEIYEKATGKLLGSGVKEYQVTDVIINPYTSRGTQVVEKFIELEQGFKVGARIFPEPKLKGFGLVAQLAKCDFSWEWYNRKEGNTFQKLQGKRGFVKVRVSGLPMKSVLEEVSFLDDARLSFHHGGARRAESSLHNYKKREYFKV